MNAAVRDLDAPFQAAEPTWRWWWIGRRQRVTYPLIGALLASGAPLGLLLMRRFVLGSELGVLEEIWRDLPTFLYLTVMTMLVFTAIGWVAGRYADRLTALSTTDPLTGLVNARAFYPRLEQEIARSRRSGTPVSFLLLDLDHLKAVNDRDGHAAGDRALQQLAWAIRQEMRSIDLGARLGGDEFGLIAVGATASAAQALAERLQRTTAAGSNAFGLPMTVSIGIVTFDPSLDRAVAAIDLTHAVDQALYEAKKTGRNRVVLGHLDQT